MNDRKNSSPMKKKCSIDVQQRQQQQQQVVRQTRSKNSWRKSFDRFGDDLTQLVLSYLSVRQRFQYECLCRQWHRVIYRSVTALNIEYLYTVKDGQQKLTVKQMDTIKTILKKCPNISFVFIPINKPFIGKVIELMAKICPNVTKLSLDGSPVQTSSSDVLSVYTMDLLIDRYHQQLKSLTFYGLTEQLDACVCRHIRQGLKQLTELNLTTISSINNNNNPVNSFALLFADQTNLDFCRRLKTFHFIYESTVSLDDSYDNFVDMCAQSLRKVDVVINENINLLSMKKLMTSLSRLTRLNDLMITHNSYDLYDRDYRLPSIVVFADQLNRIGQQCRQLHRLAIGVKIMSNEIDILLVTINKHFRQLRCLEIPCSSSTNFDIQSLNQMKQLTHLGLEGCNWELQDYEFFQKLVHHLPQLICLSNSINRLTTVFFDTINPFYYNYFVSDYSRHYRQQINIDEKVDQLSKQLLANNNISMKQLKCLQTSRGKKYLLKYR